MSTEYRILQYCDDTARAEYRNFALIVRKDDYIHVRCVLPLQEGKINSDVMKPWLTVSNEKDTWVFDEWRLWLMRMHKAYMRNPDGAWRELDKLERSESKWRTSEGGVIEQGSKETVWDVVDWLDIRILGDPHWFESELRHIIRVSEIGAVSGQEDVYLTVKERTIFLNLYSNRRAGLAVRGLRLHHRDRRELVNEVNDLMYTGYAASQVAKHLVLYVDDVKRLRSSEAKVLRRNWEIEPIGQSQASQLLRQRLEF